MVDMKFRVFWGADRLAVRARRSFYRRRDGKGRGLCWRLVPIDPGSGPGVTEMRMRGRFGLGRLERRVRESDGLWGAGRTWEVPIRRSDETQLGLAVKHLNSAVVGKREKS
jgi:hypothetical protein